MEVRTCGTCGTTKPVSEFPRRRSRGGDRWIPRSYCRECHQAYKKEWRKRTGRGDGGSSAWRKRNPVLAKEERHRGKLRRYGLTPSDYAEMLAAQGGVCAICKKRDPGGRRLAVDHDHQTGEVRELLCTVCNTRVGILEKHPKTVIAMFRYLAKHQPKGEAA